MRPPGRTFLVLLDSDPPGGSGPDPVPAPASGGGNPAASAVASSDVADPAEAPEVEALRAELADAKASRERDTGRIRELEGEVSRLAKASKPAKAKDWFDSL